MVHLVMALLSILPKPPAPFGFHDHAADVPHLFADLRDFLGNRNRADMPSCIVSGSSQSFPGSIFLIQK